ncbi:MAG: serpin family protein [Candidatus Delongbacteria bacterium]|nr:serpin family protein [Candidatus Delongbacteria bacterium]
MNRHGSVITTIIVILLFSLVGVCSRSVKPEEQPELPLHKLTDQEEQLSQVDNAFGLKLFREINRQDNSQNIFISPLSVSLALSMAVNGAAGQTRDQMIQTLEMHDLSLEDINQANRSLTEYLVGMDRDVALQIANSIWYRNGYPVKDSFLNVNRTYYLAEVNSLDFSSQSAIDRINRWVSDKTFNRIPTILDQIDPMSMMFIINAIYFKGTWTFQFDPKKTVPAPFYPETGGEMTCDMMDQEARLDYQETELMQAVNLPYGDSLFYMAILLPRVGHTVNEIMDQFSQSQWDQWRSGFLSDSVHLSLPRFKTEYEIKLNDVLQSLGMSDAFIPEQADFSAITDRSIYISQVRHKSMVEVNEEGTVAAAATIIDFRDTCVPDIRFITVNRPFIIVIHNQQTGTILFIGKLSKPEYQ